MKLSELIRIHAVLLFSSAKVIKHGFVLVDHDFFAQKGFMMKAIIDFFAGTGGFTLAPNVCEQFDFLDLYRAAVRTKPGFARFLEPEAECS